MIKSGDKPEGLGGACQTHWPKQKSMPLTEEGREAFVEAVESGNIKDQLIGKGLLYTGLRIGTLAHMQKGWIERDNGRIYIRIPGRKIKCTLSPGHRGRAYDRDSPCNRCREFRDGYFYLKNPLPRRVPVPEDDVGDLFEHYFDVHNIVGTAGQIQHKLTEIGEWAGFDFRLTATNLRMTYGQILAKKGFEGPVIRQVMGHPDTVTGRALTQRYFALSDAHGLPPYECNAETEYTDGMCSQQVFFPEQTCYHH